MTLAWNLVNDLNRNAQIVYFKNIVKFHLIVRAGTLFENDLNIPIICDRLQVLEMDTSYITLPIRRFIEQNKQLTQILLHNTWRNLSEFSLALDAISEHSALEKILIKWIQGVDLLTFQRLFGFESLRKIIFVVDKGMNLTDIENVIPSEWAIIDVELLQWVKHLTIVRK